MRPHRLLAPLVALALLGTACGGDPPGAGPPPRPTGPELYVGTRDGQLVRFELIGDTVGPVTDLAVRTEEAQSLAPVDGRGGVVTVTRFTEGGMESITHTVGVIDTVTGRMLEDFGEDGPVAGLLLSPDGRHRYEVLSTDSGIPTSVDRTDATGGDRKTLVADATHSDDAVLGGVALSPDGRTLYVVKDPWEKPTTLHAVDTGSGRARTIETGLTGRVSNIEVSRDGHTLGLTVDDGHGADGYRKTRVALLPVAGGAPRWVDAPNARTSSFTRAGDLLVIIPHRAKNTTFLALADADTGAVRPVTGGEGLGSAVSLD